MSNDAWALVWSFLYLGTIVPVGEIARRRFGVAPGLARKFVHVGVGLWVFGTLGLFESRWWAMIPAIVGMVGNYVAARTKLVAAMEEKEGHYGTVYFPLSFLILILLAWDRPQAILAGMLAMTVGDAAAATVGARWGRSTYQTWGGATKSWEGSLAMTGFTVATLLAVNLDPWLAVLAAIVAAVSEALGPRGLDNLWVPLATGALVYAAPGLPVTSLTIGAVAALLIGWYAYRRGSLSESGVLGALLTGTLIFGLAGLPGAAALIGFFASSSFLSRRLHGRTAGLEAEYAKGGRRDLGQALANGGAAALFAILSYGMAASLPSAVWLVAMAGAIAAANADTWATEIGGAFGGAPRLVTSMRLVAPGTSGAVTGAGLLASAGGGAFVALLFAGAGVLEGSALFGQGALWRTVAAVSAGGLAGSLFDSLLGATVQGIRYCEECRKETERQVHTCSRATVHRRGLPWLGNDLVNFLATLFGAAVAVAVYLG